MSRPLHFGIERMTNELSNASCGWSNAITYMASLFFRERRWGIRFAVFALLFFGVTGWAAEKSSAKNSKKELPGADIFNATNVVHIDITIPRGGVNLLRNTS